MHRFFVNPACIQSNLVTFPAMQSHQISRVLRLQPGQMVAVLNNQGLEFDVILEHVSQKDVTGRVLKVQPAPGEPKVHLTMWLCLAQREKFEGMLQKCTEVGAAEFHPLVSSRTLVQDAADTARKLERWERIVTEAAEQSGRGRIPEVHSAMRLAEMFARSQAGESLRLIASEAEQTRNIHQVLKSRNKSARQMPEKVELLIGPEGGFTEEEVSLAEKAGFIPFTLGPRILRMETAAVVAAAILMHETV